MSISMTSLLSSPRLVINDLQRQLLDRQKEAATGRKADVGLALGGGIKQAIDCRSTLEVNTSLIDGNTLNGEVLGTMQTALSAMTDLAHKFSTTVMGARSALNGQALVAQAAQQTLESFTALINSSYDGHYVFSGISADQPPLKAYDTCPPSPAKQAVDAAFLTNFGFSQASLSVDSISDTQMDAFTDGALQATFQPGPWGLNWSSATDEPPVLRIDQNQMITVPVTANAQAFKDLTQALVMAKDLGEGHLATGTFQKLVDKITGLAAKAVGGVAGLQSNLGMVQEQVTAASARLGQRNTVLQRNISNLEGVDSYETATVINTLTNQLEASYSVTSRISRLNLFEYLR